MDFDKKQQSFSSYSQQGKKEPHPSQQDQFSEYQNKYDPPQNSQSQEKIHKLNIQKRRYSYNKGNEKSNHYNYLNFNNDFEDGKPKYYTANLKNISKVGYLKGINPGYKTGKFNTSCFAQYQHCYLSGLNKYFKSNNNSCFQINKPTKSMSVENKSASKNSLQRSEYWNGNKFQYLNKWGGFQFNQRNKQNCDDMKKDEIQFQRGSASGLIVNKKQIKNKKMSINEQQSMKIDTSSYIKIEEDLSNTKNRSSFKKQSTYQNFQSKQRLPLGQTFFEHQANVKGKKLENQPQFKKIQVNKKQNLLRSLQSNNVNAEHCSIQRVRFEQIVNEKNELLSENNRLKSLISQKDKQLQRISLQRLRDNQQYAVKIQKLKSIFQKQKSTLTKNFEQQLSIYKSIKKEAINRELIKEEEQKVNLILEKNKLQSNLKKATAQIKIYESEVAAKDTQLERLKKQCEESTKMLLKFSQKQEQMRKQQQQLRVRIQENTRLRQNQEHKKQKEQHKHENRKNKTVQIPRWVSSFLRVFEDMIRKLPLELGQGWSSKKVIIVGWKVVKNVMQKAVKLGIKMPQIVSNEGEECSMMEEMGERRGKGEEQMKVQKGDQSKGKGKEQDDGHGHNGQENKLQKRRDRERGFVDRRR